MAAGMGSVKPILSSRAACPVGKPWLTLRKLRCYVTRKSLIAKDKPTACGHTHSLTVEKLDLLPPGGKPTSRSQYSGTSPKAVWGGLWVAEDRPGADRNFWAITIGEDGHSRPSYCQDNNRSGVAVAAALGNPKRPKFG